MANHLAIRKALPALSWFAAVLSLNAITSSLSPKTLRVWDEEDQLQQQFYSCAAFPSSGPIDKFQNAQYLHVHKHLLEVVKNVSIKPNKQNKMKNKTKRTNNKCLELGED
ncbi:hypothetical protein ElyMa_001808700 [Elysia marginata]|uniref:Uncharacterized protein n=1 Tax=Elysia marginata TaxID=1093978 RepID=A0AAV4EHH7_9GAST|nr:hypothetical protein ElyMa_001808700 [Elysia marginata]